MSKNDTNDLGRVRRAAGSIHHEPITGRQIGEAFDAAFLGPPARAPAAPAAPAAAPPFVEPLVRRPDGSLVRPSAVTCVHPLGACRQGGGK